ncbi:MAG: family 20 glycosylhydrolase [Clostridia bacterium]|nr:family 20 glycosylhydrolase [Clostridia bacterium]
MIIQPKVYEKHNGAFRFGTSTCARVHKTLANATLTELWENFCLGASKITLEGTDELAIKIGDCAAPSLDGHAFAINITESGICAVAKDEKFLTNAYMTLLQMIKPVCAEEGKKLFEIPCALVRETPDINVRMVHFCVFPETTLIYLKRFVRLCAALKYTHIIIEFWGTYRYKCLKELGWKEAFTYEQIKPIIDEARDVGLEPVPMFQHLGHASASRIAMGKHVVLDQNPRLATLFDEDGWTWDITKNEVKKLLREARHELYELFGSGELIHIGCDEAYLYRKEAERNYALIDYLNEIAAEITSEGRRPMMWGDMLLCRDDIESRPGYSANSPSPEIAKMLREKLDRKIIVSDWHYDVLTAPFISTGLFNELGFDTLVCPWEKDKNITAGIETSRDAYGFMLTTWHTLSMNMNKLGFASAHIWQEKGSEILGFDFFSAQTAALLRKLCPINGSYTDAGWTENQIDFLWV